VVSVGFIKPGTMKVYPNPAKDQLTIESLSATTTNTILLIDVQGKVLQKYSVKAATYQINIDQLAKGTYIIKVKNDNTVATTKFVKN